VVGVSKIIVDKNTKVSRATTMSKSDASDVILVSDSAIALMTSLEREYCICLC
jgi:hypothetical protein